MSKTVFTIGHSTHELPVFIGLLRQHAIDGVIDVRSAPFSRRQPQFNRPAIARALKEEGIAYAFLGRELGARSSDPGCYEGGRVQYARLAATDDFRHGLEMIRKGVASRRLVLMCAEKDPLDCHRFVLIARELTAGGLDVVHIRADGSLETEEDALRRLRRLLSLPENDMFRSPAEIMEEAYAGQERRIAYVRDERVPYEAGG